MNPLFWYFLIALASYFIGAIPFSYILVKAIVGKDLTKVGTGNIGAMNVRRATGSWMWFFCAMVLDGLKGFLPVAFSAYAAPLLGLNVILLKGIALNFAVLGHNYSILAYIITGKIDSGRGLATGGGGLLAYNPLYLLIALLIGLPSILLTKYLLVGQVLTPILLPIAVFFLDRRDFYPILTVCILVLIRHVERIKNFLRGKEPKLYIDEKNQS